MAYVTTGTSRRRELLILRADLIKERASFDTHYADLANFVLPRRLQFQVTDTNKGDRRNQKIIDNTATLAARTTRSGMMSGVTSPARPWFKLTTPDPQLAEVGPVKEWLDIVTRRMRTVLLKSNIYNVLPLTYGDMATFGTAAILVEEDFDTVIRFYSLPIGSYYLGLDDKGRPSVYMREFRMTVRQLILRFGGGEANNGIIDWSKFTSHVKGYYDRRELDTWIDVTHIIRKNEDYKPGLLGSKKFESLYFEQSASEGTQGQSSEDNIYLREAGYDYFPVLAPRWEVTGEDVYGTECPGMAALGDIKGLQVLQRRKAQAIEKIVNPPMVGPSALKYARPTILAGDITYLDEREGMKGFHPAHEINMPLQYLLEDIDQHQTRIQRAYFEDLFLMLSQSDRREITAREIDERHEEKLLALGPVLEQLNQDLLDPLIDITFLLMEAQGLLPEPPEEIADSPLKVEYISIMHAAQKLAGLAGIDRLTEYVARVAEFDPDVIDKFDSDQAIDEYAEVVGTPPKLVVTDDVVTTIRDNRAKAEAAAAKAEQFNQQAQGAKSLADMQVDDNSVFSELIKRGEAGSPLAQ